MGATVPREGLIRLIKDDRWSSAIARLLHQEITLEDVMRAITEDRYDTDPDVRLLAAIHIALSDIPFSFNPRTTITVWMRKRDESIRTRYFLAAALYKRGGREPEIIEMFEAACTDKAVGRFIAGHFKEPTKHQAA
jgi:hypothetical protein